MMEYDFNPTRDQEIEKYTQQAKNGRIPTILMDVLVNEVANLISKQTNEPVNDIAENIYKKAGELQVSRINYNTKSE